MKLPFIISVKVLQGYRLEMTYNDGVIAVKELNPLIQRGNLYGALADETFLRQVQITERGRSLLWPNGLEFCADALRMQDSESKKAPRPKRVAASA